MLSLSHFDSVPPLVHGKNIGCHFSYFSGYILEVLYACLKLWLNSSFISPIYVVQGVSHNHILRHQAYIYLMTDKYLSLWKELLVTNDHWKGKSQNILVLC